MARKRPPTRAEIALGKTIERIRTAKGLTRKQLGKKICEMEQQVAKYEKGALVPLAKLDTIGKKLDEEIPKKIIRRISTLRKIEFEKKIEQEELIEIYSALFPEDEPY